METQSLLQIAPETFRFYLCYIKDSLAFFNTSPISYTFTLLIIMLSDAPQEPLDEHIMFLSEPLKTVIHTPPKSYI